jgi:hypothetical protein
VDDNETPAGILCNGRAREATTTAAAAGGKMSIIVIRYNDIDKRWDVGSAFEGGYFLLYRSGYRTRKQAEAARFAFLQQVRRNAEERAAYEQRQK